MHQFICTLNTHDGESQMNGVMIIQSLNVIASCSKIVSSHWKFIYCM